MSEGKAKMKNYGSRYLPVLLLVAGVSAAQAGNRDKPLQVLASVDRTALPSFQPLMDTKITARITRTLAPVTPVQRKYNAVFKLIGNAGVALWEKTIALDWQPCLRAQPGEECGRASVHPPLSLERYSCSAKIRAEGSEFAIRWGQCFVKPQPAPHLSEISVKSIQTGDTGAIKAVINNSGAAFGKNIRLLAMSYDFNNNAITFKRIELAGLAAAAGTVVDFGVFAPSRYACSVSVTADPDSVLAESDKTDNILEAAYGLCEETTADLPVDLTMDSATARFSPEDGEDAPGSGWMQIDLLLGNNGFQIAPQSGAAIGFRFDLFDAKGGSIYGLGWKKNFWIGAGDFYTEKVFVPAELYARSCGFSAVVDPERIERDVNFVNNQYVLNKECGK